MDSKNTKLINKIKTLMADRQMNINELASAAGLQRVGLSKVLSGKTKPKIETLGKIAKALGVSPGRFFGPDTHFSEEERKEIHSLREEFLGERFEYEKTPQGQAREQMWRLVATMNDKQIERLLPIFIALISTALEERELQGVLAFVESLPSHHAASTLKNKAR